MIKIAATVILYNPDDVLLAKNLGTYAPFIPKVYIMDNSIQPLPLNHFMRNSTHYTYIHDGQNRGIAARLNQACSMALQDGFEWLLTMDQDSFFPKDMLPRYIQCISTYPDKESIAMFGVEFEKQPDKKVSECQAQAADYLITSGSMLNLSLFPEIGGFDEALFIDSVDIDYCYHAHQSGYGIFKMKNIFMHHQLGSSEMHILWKNGKKTGRSLHSPIRMYYMLRNFLYLKQKYPHLYPESFKKNRWDILVRIKNNFLYRRDRWVLVKYIYCAFHDYKKGKMGKKEQGEHTSNTME